MSGQAFLFVRSRDGGADGPMDGERIQVQQPIKGSRNGSLCQRALLGLYKQVSLRPYGRRFKIQLIRASSMTEF